MQDLGFQPRGQGQEQGWYDRAKQYLSGPPQQMDFNRQPRPEPTQYPEWLKEPQWLQAFGEYMGLARPRPKIETEPDYFNKVYNPYPQGQSMRADMDNPWGS